MGITKKVGDQSVMYRHGKLERIGPASGPQVVVPGGFTWRWQRAGDHPVELDIRVSRGKATVEALRIEREISRPAITGEDLRRLPLTSLVERAVEVAAWMHRGGSRVSLPHGRTDDERAVEERAIAAASKAAASRRRVTGDRLREVVEKYREFDGDVDAVASELYRSRAQIYRLLGKARDAGLLGEEPGR